MICSDSLACWRRRSRRRSARSRSSSSAARGRPARARWRAGRRRKRTRLPFARRHRRARARTPRAGGPRPRCRPADARRGPARPELLLAVKREVDEDRRPGRFLLTGSANLLLMKRVVGDARRPRRPPHAAPPDSSRAAGAGSAGAWSELFRRRDRAWPELLRARRRGARRLARRRAARRLSDAGPPPARRAERALWLAGYTQTYLERDLRDLSASTRCPASVA